MGSGDDDGDPATMVDVYLNDTDGFGRDNDSLANIGGEVVFEDPPSRAFQFWFEGALITAVSVVGVVCNCIAVVVLTRPRMRGSFHTLLVVLSLFDLLYLVTSMSIFGLPMLWDWWERTVLPATAAWTYAVAHIGRVGSVYLTMSVTIERYYAIVHPLRHFSWKKLLIPLSVAFSVAYNVPRFFELRYDPTEDDVVMTDFRKHPNYVKYYIFWSKFILVEMIPYVTIIVLNSAIMVKIRKSRGFQRRFRATATSSGASGKRRNRNRAGEDAEEGKDEEGAEVVEARGVRGSFKRMLSHSVSLLSTKRKRRNGSFPDGGGGDAAAGPSPSPAPSANGVVASSDENPRLLRSSASVPADGGPASSCNSQRQSQQHNNPHGSPNRQTRENNLAAVLAGISVLFVVCQSAKIVPDLYEVVYCQFLLQGGGCVVSGVIERIVSVSHLLLAVNSSANFIIYSWRGTKFREELMQIMNCRNSCRNASTATSSSPVTNMTTRRTLRAANSHGGEGCSGGRRSKGGASPSLSPVPHHAAVSVSFSNNSSNGGGGDGGGRRGLTAASSQLTDCSNFDEEREPLTSKQQQQQPGQELHQLVIKVSVVTNGGGGVRGSGGSEIIREDSV